MPDLTGFWDGTTNDPAKSAYYVEPYAWRKWRPVHANKWRWHGNANFDLEARDAALMALRTLGVSREAIGALHGISQRQVSRRLGGSGGEHEGYRMPFSVTCRSCGGPFLAARTTALYCGATCRQRANRAKKGA